MDIARPEVKRQKKVRRMAYIAAAVVLIPLVTYALSRLKPAAPSVDRATVWTDTVKRGPMLREVRGLGTLVPETIRLIPAATDGRVERRYLLPGVPVKANTVILDLSNPELQQAALDAEYQLRGAEAGLNNTKAQIAVQQANVNGKRALYDLKRSQLDQLHVRPGIDGVLQDLSVEVGQKVLQGSVLARVAQPTHLKAALKIAETQAKDIQIGLKATVDTHNGVIQGHVSRIDPAVVNGTVTVDVALEGALPQGARPDLSVEGTVEIERLTDVLFVGRPVHGEANSTVGLFKLIDDGKDAARVQVVLGRTSVNTVEIVKGLQIGDQVILSDMSAWDNFDRVQLK